MALSGSVERAPPASDTPLRPGRSRPLRRYDYIDALRGLAVTLVIASHVKNLFPDMYWRIWKLAEVGGHGVQLFFVASALTLMMSWNARHDGAPRFYIRRLFRIAPMFWLALVVFTTLYACHLYPDGSTRWHHVALTALFLHGFSPEAVNLVVPGGWTIAAEMTFYLLFPLIAVTVTSLPRAIAFLIGSIILASLGNTLLLPRLLGEVSPQALAFYSYYWFPDALPSFACGCLGFHVLRHPGLQGRASATALGMLALLLVLVTAWSPVPWYSTLKEPWSHAVLTSLAALALAVALARHSPRLLVNPLTRFVGSVSFSAYLVHFLIYGPAMAWIGPLHFGPAASIAAFLVALVVVMAVTVAISSVTYRFIEQPGITLGNSLIARLAAARSAPVRTAS